MTKESTGSFPHTIQFHIHGPCNLDCFFCFARHRGPHLFIPRIREQNILLDRLGPYLASAENLYLTGIGEPFLSPIFWDFIKGKRPSKGLTFNTNGTFLTKNAVRTLMLYPGRLHISVSLNAASRKSYAKIMGKDLFDKVVKGIRILNDEYQKNGKKPYLVITMIAVKENMHEMMPLVDLAKELDATVVTIQAGRNLRHDYVCERDKSINMKEQDLLNDPHLSEFYTEKHRQAMDYAASLGLAPGLSRDRLETGWAKTCTEPDTFLGIQGDGMTFLCCHGGKAPDNILDYPDFDSLWNSERRTAIRRTLARGEFPPECRTPSCPYYHAKKATVGTVTHHDNNETIA